ncbi:MAG: 4Fe-4S dicluster domain-containing protein [Anaerolineaceae bacterium]|nr:4Fe-4S dicluster domain-containing protein [Anaerolineaceae bacterium]
MPYVITSLCMREGSCAAICPIDCIVPGKPIDKWPQYYIDVQACIDCGACISECPHGAIFPDLEVPQEYIAKGGERISAPADIPGFDEIYEAQDLDGDQILLKFTKTLQWGDVIDLTSSLKANIEFFEEGPGYDAIDN